MRCERYASCVRAGDFLFFLAKVLMALRIRSIAIFLYYFHLSLNLAALSFIIQTVWRFLQVSRNRGDICGVQRGNGLRRGL